MKPRVMVGLKPLLALGFVLTGPVVSADSPVVSGDADLALIVAVDVSQSVDEDRYHLQMEGIAEALEDPGVLDVILSGENAGILFSLVAWADNPRIAIPWVRIGSAADAHRTARLIRGLPQQGGEFTCMERMLHFAGETLAPAVRGLAARVVVDVSGDGIDNCTVKEADDAARDRLVAAGATINGLPILVKGENDIVGAGTYRAPGYDIFNRQFGPDTDMTTLDAWFEAHVVGGPGAFLLPAQGYDDFGRAIRRKFVVEISGLGLTGGLRR